MTEINSNHLAKVGQREYQEWSLTAMTVVIFCGIVVILSFSSQGGTDLSFWSKAALGLSLAGAALLVGGFVGFLFGIPRKRQQEAAAASAQSDANERIDATLYTPNTNLEQISDWLTKALVGAGLTQISSIGTALGAIGDIASGGFGGGAASKTFVVSAMVYFSVAGFLLGYLWTSLYLGRALTEAERTFSLRKKLTRLEEQAEADLRALQTVDRQLSESEKTRPSQSELNNAVERAASSVRAQIFYRAQTVHDRNWQQEATKPAIERTIPVFRALIHSDVNQEYHRNHALLGYALKDQLKSDWNGAKNSLSVAISIRDRRAENYWYSYEANRAICTIHLDEAFKKDMPSAPSAQDAIIADLTLAAGDDWVRGWAQHDPTVTAWLKLNGRSFPSAS